jgi:hypothetical protein
VKCERRRNMKMEEKREREGDCERGEKRAGGYV